MPEVDPWGGESTALPPYTFNVHEAEFAYTERSIRPGTPGKTLYAVLTGEMVTEDGQVKDWSKEYGVKGTDKTHFEPTEGGKRAVHESGDESRMPSDRCAYSTFCKRAVAAGLPLRERGKDMLDISAFVGLSMRMEDVKISDITDKATGEKSEWRMHVPIEYLGETGSASVSAAPVTSSNGATTVTDEQLRTVAAEALAAVDGNAAAGYFKFIDAVSGLGLKGNDPRVAQNGPVWQEAIA